MVRFRKMPRRSSTRADSYPMVNAVGAADAALACVLFNRMRELGRPASSPVS